jgi:hypothetical protein
LRNVVIFDKMHVITERREISESRNSAAFESVK